MKNKFLAISLIKYFYLSVTIFCLFSCATMQGDKRKIHEFIKIKRRFDFYESQAREKNQKFYQQNIDLINQISNKSIAKTLSVYLDFLRKETKSILLELSLLEEYLLKKHGGKTNDETVIKNYAVEKQVAQEMIGNKKGYRLENQLNEYVEFLNIQFQDLYGIERFLLLTNAKKSFVKENFGSMTLIGALCILSQKRVRILQYEATVLQKIYGSLQKKPTSETLLLWVNHHKIDTLDVGKSYQLKAESFFQSSLKGKKLVIERDTFPITRNQATILLRQRKFIKGAVIVDKIKYFIK